MQSKITKHAKGEDHITENQDPQMIQILKLWKKDFEMSMINKEKKKEKDEQNRKMQNSPEPWNLCYLKIEKIQKWKCNF